MDAKNKMAVFNTETRTVWGVLFPNFSQTTEYFLIVFHMKNLNILVSVVIYIWFTWLKGQGHSEGQKAEKAQKWWFYP